MRTIPEKKSIAVEFKSDQKRLPDRDLVAGRRDLFGPKTRTRVVSAPLFITTQTLLTKFSLSISS